MAVTLRPICREDEPFLLEVYAGARRDELARVPWDETQKRAFLTFQFTAQHQHYQDHFAEAEYCVVLDGGLPVGRLYVDRRVDEIRILDVAVLPEHQGRGIGRTLIQTLLREAEGGPRPLAADGMAARIAEDRSPAERRSSLTPHVIRYVVCYSS